MKLIIDEWNWKVTDSGESELRLRQNMKTVIVTYACKINISSCIFSVINILYFPLRIIPGKEPPYSSLVACVPVHPTPFAGRPPYRGTGLMDVRYPATPGVVWSCSRVLCPKESRAACDDPVGPLFPSFRISATSATLS